MEIRENILIKVKHSAVFTAFILLCLLLYSLSFQSEFHFDDYLYIVNALEIRTVDNIFSKIAFRPFLPDRSIVECSFALNYAFSGLTRFSYQLVNILIHAVNAFLIYLILGRLLLQSAVSDTDSAAVGRRIFPLAVLCSLLFAAHPLAVNSVAYLAQRHGLLATLFYLSAFYLFMRATAAKGVAAGILYGSVLLCFIFAIHSKPMAVTLPLLLLLYWFLFQFHAAKSNTTRLIMGLVLFGFFFFCTMFFALSSGMVTETSTTAGFSATNLWSPRVQFMTESKVLVQYWKIILFPFPDWLSADRGYSLTKCVDTGLIGAWLFHSLLLLLSVISYKKGFRIVSLGILWVYITLAPYLFVPVQDLMVDYKTYLPSVGVVMILGELFYGIGKRYKTYTAIYFLLVILVMFGWSTCDRITTFKTEISFWNDVIDKESPRARPYNNRGLAYKRQGNYLLALDDFRKTIQISPEYYLGYANGGDVCMKLGRVGEAMAYYQIYRNLRPDNADAYIRLGNGYAAMRDWEKASTQYYRAAELDGRSVDAWFNLGLAWAQSGKWDSAEKALTRAIQVDPTYYKALGTLGSVKFSTGNVEEAAQLFKDALKIQPDYADGLYNLAVYYVKKGQIEEAYLQAHRLQNVAPKAGRDLLERLDSRSR